MTHEEITLSKSDEEFLNIIQRGLTKIRSFLNIEHKPLKCSVLDEVLIIRSKDGAVFKPLKVTPIKDEE